MERSIIFTVAVSIAALLFVLELVRRRKLREEYSLLWLFTAFVMIIISVWRDLLHGLADFFGIAYPPNLLFLIAALLTFFILLYYSVVITRLTHENKVIAQEVALLRYEVESLRQQKSQPVNMQQQAILRTDDHHRSDEENDHQTGDI